MWSIQKLAWKHLPGILALNDALDWTFTDGDIATMFAGGQTFGHCAGDRLISTAAVFDIGAQSASIGAVMVHPDFRRRGLAAQLMHHIVGLPEYSGRHLRLVATNEGEALYRKLDFQIVCRLSKMVRALPWRYEPGDTGRLRAMRDSDLDAVVELDARAVGGERRRLLEARFEQSYRAVVHEARPGDVSGFAMGTDQRGQLICGPVVTTMPDIAVSMLHSLSRQHQGQIRIDVPDDNRELLALLHGQGFRRIANPPVMTLGPANQTLWRAGYNAPVAQMFG